MSFIDLQIRDSRRGHARTLLEVRFHSLLLKSGHARVQQRLVSCATYEAQDSVTTTLADICSHAFVTVPPTDSVEQAVRLMHTPAMRRVPVVDGGSWWTWGRSGIGR